MKNIKKKFSTVYIKYFFLTIALAIMTVVSGCRMFRHPQKTKYGPPRTDFSKIKSAESNVKTSANIISKIKSFLF